MVLCMEFQILLDWAISFFADEQPVLRNAASLGSILSLGAIAITYVVKQIQKDKQEKQYRARVSKNLHTELIDTLESLDREKHKEDACSFKIDDKQEIFFMNRRFNHDFYDSLIFSGHINFLRPELQQQVQNIFNRIKTHNNYLDLVMRMQDEARGNTIPKKTYKYYVWMDKNEVSLSKDIDNMLKKLEKDFKK